MADRISNMIRRLVPASSRRRSPATVADETVKPTRRAARERLAAERQLGVELREYTGEWVAINEQHVIASAPTAEELISMTRGQDVDRRLRVAAGPEHNLLSRRDS
ncbi:MAG TPA: DUF5678 domain-containing protein [Solirubrobacteraceae bacterium]|jgi:hypothetical protein